MRSVFPIKTRERYLIDLEEVRERGVLDFLRCGCGCGGLIVSNADVELVCVNHPKGKHGDHVYEGSIEDELFVWGETCALS